MIFCTGNQIVLVPKVQAADVFYPKDQMDLRRLRKTSFSDTCSLGAGLFIFNVIVVCEFNKSNFIVSKNLWQLISLN
jgi:hypothetical protein